MFFQNYSLYAYRHCLPFSLLLFVTGIILSFSDFFFFKSVTVGSSLVASWLGFRAFTAMTQVRSLVREVRSSKPRGTAKT